MNNIIYTDEYIIGSMENIWKFFKDEIKREMDDNTISFEILHANIDCMIEVMQSLEADSNVDSDTLLKIEEHSMGGYVYKILKEE